MALLIPCTETHPPQELGVTIPGVGKLKAFKQRLEESPSPSDLAANMLGQAQPALAPIIQILRIVEAVVAIVDALKAVKNPFKLVKKLKNVVKALANLSSFIPGVAHIKMVRDILKLIAGLLDGFTGAIDRWVSEIKQLSNALTCNEVLDDSELAFAIGCSKKKLIEIQGGTTTTLKDIGSILGLVARVLDIIKSFVPGNVAKHVVDATKKIALIPDDILHAATAIGTAQSPAELNALVTKLRDVENQIKTGSRLLYSISSTLTSVVGE